jgi:hypothetical protein
LLNTTDSKLTPNVNSGSRPSEITSRQVSPSVRLRENAAELKELRLYSFIELSLPYQSEVTLCLFDQLGQPIGTVFTDKLLPVGTHQLTFSPEICNGTPSFYRLIVKGGAKVYIEVKRLH